MAPANLKTAFHRDETSSRHILSGLKHLLATTALTVLIPHVAQAQVVIDGSTETVNGGGGGTQASPWNIGNTLTVGDTGTGQLDILNGGVVTSAEGRLGNASTGNGTVNVDGSGSDWTVSGQLFVGYDGTGSMTVSDSATVDTTSAATIAFGTGSTGTLVVTDSATVRSVGGLYVSEGGTAYLTVSAGGMASVTNSGGLIRIANDAGSYGEATVTGSGSSLKAANNGTLFTGYYGTGVLTIQDSATVEADGGFIGYEGTATGTITVQSNGSLNLASTGTDLTIGRQNGSVGTLNILTGGSADVGDRTVLGDFAGAQGTINVTGSGSQFETRNLYVGDAGTGTVNMSGGTVTVEFPMSVGVQTGSSGTVTNDGGILTVGLSLLVGEAGTGTVTVKNGGSLSVTDVTRIGQDTSSTGFLTITGSGSTWTASGNVSVGYEGTGTLDIQDGATANLSDELLVGDKAGSTGTATVDAATLTAGNILIGNTGKGTMTISGGSTVTADDFIVGNAADSDGTTTVTGSGSSLSLSVELNVGLEGTGTLNVNNGGNVVVTDDVRIGDKATGAGTVNIDGASSKITSNANTWIGDEGTGTVALTNGADVYADQVTYVGYASTGTGTLTLDGSGTYWESGGDFFAGVSGTGNVSVTNGADFTGDYVSFGKEPGSSATIIVDGSGSSWTNTGDLYVAERGTADLTISNGATVSNAVAYIGYDNDTVGTVKVDGAGSMWTNSSNVYVGEDGTGTLTISNGGTVSIGGLATLDLGNASASSGTLNIGAASGDTATGAGTLDAKSVQFGTGTGLIVFNHTDTNYQFDAAISGAGNVMVYSGETVLTGANTYTGATDVHGGLLTVNGSITGTVTLLGGTLGGTGTVGNVAVQSGSSVAPGNSVGTLNVAGMMFGSGSSYDVELNDGGFVAGTNNDLINATSAVVIAGGAVKVTAENGTDNGATYTGGTYTIITAAGGVTGTFDSVSDSFVFLDFSLGYDSNTVYLTSTKIAFFTDITETANQTATAAAQEALGSGTTVYDALTGLVGDNASARGAFDALSGEVHASVHTVLIDDSRFLRKAANDRIRAAFENAGSGSIAVATHGHAMNARPVAGEGFTVWGQTYGAIGSWDGNGNAATLDRTIGGLLMGGDHAVTETVRIGVLAGYSRSSADVDARASSATVDSYHLGLYGGSRFGAVTLRGGGAVTWNTIDTDRTVAFTGFSETLSANYGGRTFQAFGEAGYGVELDRARIEPYAGVALVHLSTDRFTETGGSAVLTVSGDDTTTTTATLGVRGETEVEIAPSRMALLSAGLAWRHAFGDVTPQSAMAFAGGTQFSIAGVPIARDALVVEFGAGIVLNPVSKIGLTYSGELGSGLAEHGLKASVAISF
jgi:outer membrane autotransporter protein